MEPLRWALALRPAWIALEQVPPVHVGLHRSPQLVRLPQRFWFRWVGAVLPRSVRARPARDAGIIGPISENTDWRLIIEPRPWVYIRELGDTRRATQYRIRSVDFSHQGEYLCTSGERTGGHCGELKELRVGSQDYGQVHMCGVKEGDSGAPVVRWGSARGIQVQGVSNILHEDLCKVNFQSAHIAEDLLDVAIMTRNP